MANLDAPVVVRSSPVTLCLPSVFPFCLFDVRAIRTRDKTTKTDVFIRPSRRVLTRYRIAKGMTPMTLSWCLHFPHAFFLYVVRHGLLLPPTQDNLAQREREKERESNRKHRNRKLGSGHTNGDSRQPLSGQKWPGV